MRTLVALVLAITFVVASGLTAANDQCCADGCNALTPCPSANCLACSVVAVVATPNFHQVMPRGTIDPMGVRPVDPQNPLDAIWRPPD